VLTYELLSRLHSPLKAHTQSLCQHTRAQTRQQKACTRTAKKPVRTNTQGTCHCRSTSSLPRHMCACHQACDLKRHGTHCRSAPASQPQTKLLLQQGPDRAHRQHTSHSARSSQTHFHNPVSSSGQLWWLQPPPITTQTLAEHTPGQVTSNQPKRTAFVNCCCHFPISVFMLLKQLTGPCTHASAAAGSAQDSAPRDSLTNRQILAPMRCNPHPSRTNTPSRC
jgi:hypothetical protein